MPAFLTAKNLKPFIPQDLTVTSSQIEFRTVNGTRAFGYAAELLPKVCGVFVDALANTADLQEYEESHGVRKPLTYNAIGLGFMIATLGWMKLPL